MDSEQTLELLSTVRHEWMNRLQLISLYAALDPVKLEELYERYRKQADEESALVRLNVPQTSLVVIQANWEGRLTYTISTDQLAIDDARVAEMLDRLLKYTVEPIHVTFTDGLMVRVKGTLPEDAFTSADVYEQNVEITTFHIKEGK
ncbi:Spo0B domain-containing protein [Exiguobacterium qingdaonense]|uniref:Spo0B domain-containing protein n=1 Tax=Exiguobacterium qingdaonense TaxID=2751251 RepID=UPI001BE80DA6|nr:Spo0B domain-containing protein [Exiguobacterium qingdaonense]